MFPEATSSDGSHVLPFRSSLFEPAIRTGASITPAAIRYLPSSAVEKRVAYWGSAVLVPHLFQALRLRHLSTEIHFAAPRISAGNRKTEAEAAWREVVALREGSLVCESRQPATNRASKEKQGRENPGIENLGIHPAGHAKAAPAPLDPLAAG